MNNYDISVVMGSKNRKNLIKATIESIRNNGFNGSIEIIVVDGGSTDGTCDWLAKQTDVFTIVQPNYSVEIDGIKKRAHSWGEFMNIGFKFAHSEFICMVSDDLILAPGCLQKGYDEIRNRLANGEKIGGGAFYFREYPRHDYYRVIMLAGNNVHINHGIYYRPAMETVNWLDETNFSFYCADGDFTMRLNRGGWKTIAFEECFAAHLVHVPKSKKSIPGWMKQDMETYDRMYPEKVENNIKKHDQVPEINVNGFWKHALKNVLLGYLLKYIDKYEKNGLGYLKRL